MSKHFNSIWNTHLIYHFSLPLDDRHLLFSESRQAYLCHWCPRSDTSQGQRSGPEKFPSTTHFFWWWKNVDEVCHIFDWKGKFRAIEGFLKICYWRDILFPWQGEFENIDWILWALSISHISFPWTNIVRLYQQINTILLNWKFDWFWRFGQLLSGYTSK